MNDYKKKKFAVLSDISELFKTVRPERKARQLSQAELGRLCGVSASIISHIENGDLTPSLTVVAKVLSALGKRLYVGNMT